MGLAETLLLALALAMVTFVLSWVGGTFGAILGERGGSRAEIAGGLVLIALGAKILVEHLSAG
ncbi:MAG: manganese efflux pump [Fibrobacterales bacterium]|nr:manganese efflux pump [Fibrobacterales bacterium]